MKWKMKAFMQKQVSRLPVKSSYWLYHQIMRWSGAYKVFYDPTENFKLSRNIFETVGQYNSNARDKTFLEIGTGRVISTPLGLWLLGAQRITTIDINPFLREEVILKSIDYIRRNRVEIEKLFGEHAKNQYFKKRLKLLISAPDSLSEIFKLTNIEYLCPVEGTSLPLENIVLTFITLQASWSTFLQILLRIYYLRQKESCLMMV